MGEANFYYFTCLNCQINKRINITKMSALRLASVCRAVLRPALSGAPAQRGIAPAQRGIATSSVSMAKDIKTPDSLQASVGIVRSMYNKRQIAHICHEDTTAPVIFYVYKGIPT